MKSTSRRLCSQARCRGDPHQAAAGFQDLVGSDLDIAADGGGRGEMRALYRRPKERAGCKGVLSWITREGWVTPDARIWRGSILDHM